MVVFVVAGSPAARAPWGLRPGRDDWVVAADLGAAHALRWGWPIHLLIGDLDSLPAEIVSELQGRGTAIERAPAAKDETDTELALARGLAHRPEQIVLCAAFGGRTDHFLANVLLLAHPRLASVDAVMVDGGETVRLMQARPDGAGASLDIAGHAGDLLSLLPFGSDAEGVTTEGLLYPLHAETLHLGSARGMSNVLTGPRSRVTLARGRLLAIHTRMAER